MKKSGKGLWAVSAALTAGAGVFMAYVLWDTPQWRELPQFKGSLRGLTPRRVLLRDLHLYTQPDPYRCIVASLAVTAAYLQKRDIPPLFLIQKYGLRGGLHLRQILDVWRRELPQYRVTYRHGSGGAALIAQIHRQLADGIPVPVFLGSRDPYRAPHFDFHASVVKGLDLTARKILIANVYGYEEEISLTEFLNRMAYRGTGKYPFLHRLVLKLGLMDQNAWLCLERK